MEEKHAPRICGGHLAACSRKGLPEVVQHKKQRGQDSGFGRLNGGVLGGKLFSQDYSHCARCHSDKLVEFRVFEIITEMKKKKPFKSFKLLFLQTDIKIEKITEPPYHGSLNSRQESLHFPGILLFLEFTTVLKVFRRACWNKKKKKNCRRRR